MNDPIPKVSLLPRESETEKQQMHRRYERLAIKSNSLNDLTIAAMERLQKISVVQEKGDLQRLDYDVHEEHLIYAWKLLDHAVEVIRQREFEKRHQK